MKPRFFVVALLLSSFSFAQSTQALTPYFNDVNSSTSYVDAIYWTVNQGITIGYDDGSGNWGPDNCVTRAELLKMMALYVYTDDFEDGKVGSESFSDVSPSDWFYGYVRYAENLGIVEGYADGTFKPNNCVNRVEAMKIAVKTMAPRKEIVSSEPLYYWGTHGPIMVDMDPNAWYAPYARPLFNLGRVGTEHTRQAQTEYGFSQDYLNFFPADSMSRKEAAYLMQQIDQYGI